MLPEAGIGLLKALLGEVTVAVLDGDKVVGTAFFITDDLLLSCRHVVHGRAELGIRAVGRHRRPAVLDGTPDAQADLALLRVDPDTDDGDQPCAALDDRIYEGEHLVAGFPAEAGSAAGLELLPATAGQRLDLATGVVQSLQIHAGAAITFGNSGGPVLSLQTGAVVAVVRVSKQVNGAMGGVAVPITRAVTAFPRIAGLVRTPVPAVRRWRDALGRGMWQQLGKQWDMEELIDLYVSGRRTRWEVGTELDGTAVSRTAVDLGEDVAEALFRWAAQRRRIHGREEVELLGRLLAKGLVPDAAMLRLRRAAGADRVHVRLHVDGEQLADIPWELATVPGQPTTYFAADESFLFSRVARGPAGDDPRPGPLTGPVEVLAVLSQPTGWRFADVNGRKADKPYRWPDVDFSRAKLTEALTGNPFKPDTRLNPPVDEVTDAIREGQYTVLHYVGVGKLGRDGRTPLIALGDDDGDGEPESWYEANQLLELAAQHGVRLVVLEFMLPPEGVEFDPVTPSALGSMITGATTAVVLSQQPVHPKQLQIFNREFYRGLRHGRSVEAAAQLARKALANISPVEDEAGFGWFSVITGPQAGNALVAHVVGDPTAQDPKQGRAGGRTNDPGRGW